MEGGSNLGFCSVIGCCFVLLFNIFNFKTSVSDKELIKMYLIGHYFLAFRKCAEHLASNSGGC